MLVIQVGQCGIQLGSSLFENLDSGIADRSFVAYPCNSFTSLLVDTEHKTFSRQHGSGSGLRSASSKSNSSVCRPAETGTQRARNHYVADCGRVGRGNIWTFGFSTEISKFSSLLRKIMEREPFVDGFLLIHSLAGGTGSGLGSRILEFLRNTYPSIPIMTVSVTPFVTGETPVQYYNAMLTLHTLQRNSDVVALVNNDDVMRVLQNRVKNAGGGTSRATRSLNVKVSRSTSSSRSNGGMVDSIRSRARQDKITMDLLNKYIASCISGVISPLVSSSSSSGSPLTPYKRTNLFDIITSVTPMPSHKLCTLASSFLPIGERSYIERTEWEYLGNTLLSNLPKSTSGQPHKTLSAQLYLRGLIRSRDTFQDPTSAIEKVENKLLHSVSTYSTTSSCCSLYNPFPLDIISSYAVPPSSIPARNSSQQTEKSMTMIWNSNSIVPTLETVVERSQLLMSKKAYLGWYKRFWKVDSPSAPFGNVDNGLFDVDKVDAPHEVDIFFRDALESVQCLLDNYREL